MKKYYVILLGIFIILFSISASAYTTFPPGIKPIPIGIAFHINNITQINERDSSMAIVGTLRLQWKDPRLAFNPATVNGQHLMVFTDEAAQRQINYIWQPHVILEGSHGPRQIQKYYLAISSDGTVNYIDKSLVTIDAPVNLKQFPFDKQTAVVTFEPFTYSTKYVIFYPLPNNKLLQHELLYEWSIKNISSQITEDRSFITDEPFSQYQVIIKYHRISFYYVFQIMLPVIFLVLFSNTGFWVARESAVNRIAISLTSVLAIEVFKWGVANDLPHVDYHTFFRSIYVNILCLVLSNDHTFCDV